MEIAAWIIAGILSVTLLVFLIVGIVFMAKMFGLIKEARQGVDEARKLVAKGQDVVNKADVITSHLGGAAANIEDFTSTGSIIKSFVGRFAEGILSNIFRKRK